MRENSINIKPSIIFIYMPSCLKITKKLEKIMKFTFKCNEKFSFQRVFYKFFTRLY